MRFQGQSVLGIDISAGSVRAVAIRRDETSLTVTNAVSIPTPAGSLDKSVVVSVPAVSRAIKQIVKRMGYPFTRAAIAVPAEHTLIWWIDLPVMDDKALRAATPFEARKHLSFPVDQSEVQIIVDRTKIQSGDTTMKALLVAAPRDVAHSRAEALEGAGLHVGCLEIEAFALMRTMNATDVRQQMLWNSHSRAYLQLGEEQSSMSVIQAGSLKFVRSISWGGNRIADALTAALDVPTEQAHAILEDPASEMTEQGLLRYRSHETNEMLQTDALADEFERLTRETRRLMNYYRSLFTEGSYEGILNEITLCGGTANLNGLADYLSGRLGIDCDLGDPFGARSLHLEPDVRDAVGGCASSYAVAVGLALGELQQLSVSAGLDTDTEYVWRRSTAVAVGA